MALSGVVGATVKVAAIYGLLRKGSYNRGLIESVIELSKGAVEGVEIKEVDIASLPMLNTDLEKQGTFPAEVEAFRQKILDADSILFASPEYNFSVTAPLKNAMDWGSRPPNVWGGKVAGIVSARGLLGGARGQFHLCQIGIFIDLHFLNKPEFFLNAFEPPPKFNPLNGDLIDEDAKLKLKQILLSLKGWRERPIFGKIRYMNYAGCKRKFDVDRYVAYVTKLVGEVKKRKAENLLSEKEKVQHC